MHSSRSNFEHAMREVSHVRLAVQLSVVVRPIARLLSTPCILYFALLKCDTPALWFWEKVGGGGLQTYLFVYCCCFV